MKKLLMIISFIILSIVVHAEEATIQYLDKPIEGVSGFSSSAWVCQQIKINQGLVSKTGKVSANLKFKGWKDIAAFTGSRPSLGGQDVSVTDIQDLPEYQATFTELLGKVLENEVFAGAVPKEINISQGVNINYLEKAIEVSSGFSPACWVATIILIDNSIHNGKMTINIYLHGWKDAAAFKSRKPPVGRKIIRINNVQSLTNYESVFQALLVKVLATLEFNGAALKDATFTVRRRIPRAS